MELVLSEEEAEVLRDFLRAQFGNLSMEISHTDNPDYRRDLRVRRDVLLRIHDRLGDTLGPAEPQAS